MSAPNQKQKMAANKNAALSVGIKFFMAGETDSAFVQIPGIINPGAAGDKGTFKDCTPVDAEGYQYIAAVAEGEDRELPFYYYPSNAEQAQLQSAAERRLTKKIKLEFTKLGKSATFELVLSGWALSEPTFNEASQFVVYAKKNTSVATTWADLA